MMTTLIFDTETTGIRPKNNTDYRKEPYIIQVAAKLVDEEKVLAQFSTFIQPKDPDTGEVVKIPKEKFFLDQGYTDEFIDRVGADMDLSIRMFNQLVRRASEFVCHNANFDYPIMRAAYQRLGQDFIPPYPVYCSMLTLEPHLKLPGKYGKYKWPTLMESYKALIDPAGFVGAHDAMDDVTATHKVWLAIREQAIKPVRIN